MGVISKTLNRTFSKFFNPKYYGLLKIVILSGIKSSHQGGKTRISGSRIKYNDAFSLLGMYNEIIYQENYKFKAKSQKPVIIDCGANIGISLLYFQKLYPEAELVGIEADPNVRKLLDENLKTVGCEAKIIEKALWSTSGETLQFGSQGGDSGSLFSTKNSIDVETIGIKDLLSPYDHIDLLKIDIEGAEYETLLNCGDELKKVDFLFIEFHSFPSKPQGLEDILKITTESGFRYKILPAKRMTQPFINTEEDCEMDLQLNIFFFRA
ncbi:MAG: FkbM family methyltransferase [Salibacteraceae bacterium]|jgi:FkbM family methyltransferase